MKEIQQKIYALNTKNGFWDAPYKEKEKLTLIATEVVEAFEEVRKHKTTVYIKEAVRPICPDDFNLSDFIFEGSFCKPEGELMEIADVVIRCLDVLAHLKDSYDHEPVGGRKYEDVSDFYFELLSEVTCPKQIITDKLANIIILCEEYCEGLGWDLERAIEVKYEFNLTRPFKHGKKF